ncbi:cardiolipin synthase [Pasteurella testudinis DSM 23072]|uniref:Cardiolipin synthase A n=1 Tax=Pasteurella testudinis DSM 23072 TaxID=1122938 RepID=A0A1W1V0D5_9PAST|nr:cardiolipin synthase [Pasteurella testudinis]SMB86444.1 cardiolipin synthase [Pasteurella testudinis DSM 23072]SUB51800.1 protein YmdC [Pasteurella testudinis]
MNIELSQIIGYLLPAFIWIFGIGITARLAFKKQAVSVTLAWLLIIYMIPIFGIIAYLILGEIKLGRRRGESFRKLEPLYTEWFGSFDRCSNLTLSNDKLRFKPLFALSRHRVGIPCVLNNELHILNTPQTIIQAMIHDIDQAQKTIQMTFYIWFDGGLVNDVMNALIRAAKRGVKIQILLDSVGSNAFLGSKNYRYMRDNGIRIEEALHANLLRMFFRRVDLRQHRKIVVIDDNIAYTGSMNMVDPRYFKQDANVGEWIDIMVRIEGPVSLILQGVHSWDWQMETEEDVALLPQCPVLQNTPDDSHGVQILPSGPGFPQDLMTQSLLLAISSARHSITITSPYFVPSAMIAESLATAAIRGVEVKLILPEKNDSFLVEWASRTFFDELLEAGVKIYRFEDGLLHTKSILIDSRLALVGTVNMDARSFMLNFEVTMIVDDMRFGQEVETLQKSYLAQSTLMDLEQWYERPIYQRFFERLFFLFSPLL